VPKMESSVYCEIESFEDETSNRNDLVAVVGMGVSSFHPNLNW
jgi:hypothetical protein